MTRSTLHEKGLPNKFEAESVNATVYLLNRCPTKVVQNKTPIETSSKQKPFSEYLDVSVTFIFQLKKDIS